MNLGNYLISTQKLFNFFFFLSFNLLFLNKKLKPHIPLITKRFNKRCNKFKPFSCKFFFFFYTKSFKKTILYTSNEAFLFYNLSFVERSLPSVSGVRTLVYNYSALYTKFNGFVNLFYNFFLLNFNFFTFGNQFFFKESYILNKRLSNSLPLSFKSGLSFFFYNQRDYNPKVLKFLKKISKKLFFFLIIDSIMMYKFSTAFRKLNLLTFTVTPFNASPWLFFYSIPVYSPSFFNQLLLLSISLTYYRLFLNQTFKNLCNFLI